MPEGRRRGPGARAGAGASPAGPQAFADPPRPIAAGARRTAGQPGRSAGSRLTSGAARRRAAGRGAPRGGRGTGRATWRRAPPPVRDGLRARPAGPALVAAAAPAWRSSARIICDCAAFSRGRLASSTARRSAKSSVCAAAARSAASWPAISRASARAASSAPDCAMPARWPSIAPSRASSAARPASRWPCSSVSCSAMAAKGCATLPSPSTARSAARPAATSPLRPLQRLEPDPEAVEHGPRVAPLDLGELRLQRREPGEDRLGRRVLLGVEPGELLGDLGEGVLRRLVEPGLHRVEPRGEAVERRPGVAPLDLGEPRLQRRQPGEDRLGRGVLLGVKAGELLGNLREGVLRRLVEPGLQRVEPGGEAVERRLRAGDLGRELGETGFERREPGQDGLGGGVLLGVEPGELLGDLGEGVLRRLVEPGLHRLEPRGEAVEHRPRVARLPARRAAPPAARAGRGPSRSSRPSGRRAG